MDGTHPIWRSAPMRDALARSDAGAIVRIARRAAEITLADLGQAVGYTAASLSRMERGRQPLRDIELLRRLAAALDIPPGLLGIAPAPGGGRATPYGGPAQPRPGAARVSPDLLGEERDSVRRRNLLAGMAGATTSTVLGPAAAAQAPTRPSLEGLEDLLLHRPAPASGTEATPAAVQTAVTAARRDFQTCRYDALARTLPSRIALAQALTDDEPEHAAAAVAELFNVASRLCIKWGEDGLAAVTADRALTAALGSADALTVAEARRMVSSAWRRQGHYARATDVAVTAAQQLAADRTTTRAERLSVQGNLYATAAYTAAKHGDRHTAHTLIAEADTAARHLGTDGLLHGAVFGPSQVLLHRISISHLLGDAGQAIDHARGINPAQLPTAERRARYWIDVARSYHQWDKPERCYSALRAAEHAAPQEVRRASVRTMVTALLPHDRTLPGVQAFARRLGALP